MSRLALKLTHKPVQTYSSASRQFDGFGVTHEGAVKSAFLSLSASNGERARLRRRSRSSARQHDWTLVPEWEIRRPRSATRSAAMCKARAAARPHSTSRANTSNRYQAGNALRLGLRPQPHSVRHSTERLFRTVFNNADFARRNIIVAKIEKVIDALASQNFSRAARSCEPLRCIISSI